jgi:hypothetical protein
MGCEITLGVSPQLQRGLAIDEFQDGDDDRGRQRCDRQIKEPRG